MYTIITADGDRDLVLENGLGQLENDFVSVRKSKLNKRLSLDPGDRAIVCAFMAAIQARTKLNRESLRNMWKSPLEQMERMRARIKTASEQEKRHMAALSGPSDPSKLGFHFEEVKEFVEKPLQTWLPATMNAAVPLLCALDFVILTTDDQVGFITSDNPCVWFDPQAYKRPPMYRQPALMYESIEITLPVSPKQCILLNRQGINGYRKVPPDVMNRRTRFFADESFVVHKNIKRDIWFDRGLEPDDSWDKTH